MSTSRGGLTRGISVYYTRRTLGNEGCTTISIIQERTLGNLSIREDIFNQLSLAGLFKWLDRNGFVGWDVHTLHYKTNSNTLLHGSDWTIPHVRESLLTDEGMEIIKADISRYDIITLVDRV